MAQARLPWTSDVRVSLPSPIDPETVAVDLGAGFVFTTDGCLAINISPVEAEALQMPLHDPGEAR